ncbi:Complement component C6 [Collichthys lucidus]|uniref:Complement component C6 n=1 Tax=Collichthys lucidus TaxID=240159 RepID=A0A4U5V8U1_COLLU|nr:Complement component C6 [Collichthys lucidus]
MVLPKHEEPCHISIFAKQETCDNDDDFTVGWIDELPPGVQGCLRPQKPANSFLRKSKQYYNFGEDEEFQCYTGFDLEGFQYINCLPDGTWSQPSGSCIKPESLCILNTEVGVAVSMSLCSFHAGRCHNDPYFFISNGVCDPAPDLAKLEWAKFRAKMASKSVVQEPCDLDTCYEWETCSASKKCECKVARNCQRNENNMFCVKLTKSQRTRSMDLCSVGALKCASYQFEIVNEGACPST